MCSKQVGIDSFIFSTRTLMKNMDVTGRGCEIHEMYIVTSKDV